MCLCFHGFDPLQPPRGITPCSIRHLSKPSWPHVNTVSQGFQRALDLAGVRGELSVFPRKDKSSRKQDHSLTRGHERLPPPYFDTNAPAARPSLAGVARNPGVKMVLFFVLIDTPADRHSVLYSSHASGNGDVFGVADNQV